jgi:threonine/homoserine/homoserine lactone efflux protein
LVLMSNPKALILFGALFPQFMDLSGDYLRQVVLMGGTAMATALVFDSAMRFWRAKPGPCSLGGACFSYRARATFA